MLSAAVKQKSLEMETGIENKPTKIQVHMDNYASRTQSEILYILSLVDNVIHLSPKSQVLLKVKSNISIPTLLPTLLH